MTKILISVPKELYARIRVALPARQRSFIIAKLIEQEVKNREDALYHAACKLNQNEGLTKEMQEWEHSFGTDGLENDEFDSTVFEQPKEIRKK